MDIFSIQASSCYTIFVIYLGIYPEHRWQQDGQQKDCQRAQRRLLRPLLFVQGRSLGRPHRGLLLSVLSELQHQASPP